MNFHPMQVLDSLRNLVSGLGTAKDPSHNSHYHYHELNPAQLNAAYRSNWVARRVVDAPAEDATREWRGWQAGKDQVEAIEALEKSLNIQQKVRQAITRARLYGGAAILMGVDGSGEPQEPLDYDALGADCLRFAVVLSRYELAAATRIYDVQSPWFHRPTHYTVGTPTEGILLPEQVDSLVRVHPSRVIEFTGNELPDWRLQTMGGGWGDSVLQTLDETLKDFGLTMGGIANMVNDAKVDVIGVTNLADKLSSDARTQRLFERFSYANVGKSTLNALIIDKDEEEWERITTSFAGLPEIMIQFMVLASGGAGIPVSRLMGAAPGKGLTTVGGGESDLRNYYDDVTSKQKTDYSPRLTPLDNVLQISALGRLDPGIYYDWNPLYLPDPKDVAAVAYQKSQTTQVYANTGLLNEDMLRKSVVSQLLEDGTYPGMDDAIDEFGEEPELEQEPSPEDLQAHVGMMQRSAAQLRQLGNFATQDARRVIGDATPRTLYVRRDVLNADEIIAWFKRQGIETTLPASDMHVTVAFSRQPVDWMRIGEDRYSNREGGFTVSASGIRMLERYGAERDAVVLLFNSSQLSSRHEDIGRAGASWDWPEYQPHVTISYQVPDDVDVSTIEPWRGQIVLGPEIFEQVRENWKTGVVEDAR